MLSVHTEDGVLVGLLVGLLVVINLVNLTVLELSGLSEVLLKLFFGNFSLGLIDLLLALSGRVLFEVFFKSDGLVLSFFSFNFSDLLFAFFSRSALVVLEVAPVTLTSTLLLVLLAEISS